MGLLRRARPVGIFLIDPLDEIKKEQEGKLLGIADRVGIAAAIEIVANLVDAAAHLGREGHGLIL